MENLAIKQLIEFYKSYIKNKKEHIEMLDYCERHVDEDYYFYQCGLLQAYSDMLSEFIEVLGGDE